MPNTQTDQDALRLTHAIALQESGSGGKPNYNAVGDNGTSHGAYQWQPGNFESAAKAAGLNPSDMSPENQDKVAYYQVKQYKDQGLDPGQIASKWNSGSPDNWKDHSGTTVINGKPIHYDTPAYVKGVQKYYQQLQGNQPSTSYNPTPFSNPAGGTQAANPGALNLSGTQGNPTASPSSDSYLGQLGQNISNRAQEGGTAASKALTGGSELLQGNIGQGGQDIFNGALQTAGAGAGLLGDAVSTTLEHIPVVGTAVKGVENLLGQGVGALAKTPTGQAVAQAIGTFATQHPEISKDIGAAFNIVTAIPILKGLSIVKNVAMDATAQALKGVAEKGVAQDLAATIARTKSGSTFLSQNPNVVKTLIDERALPDIEGGKLMTENASTKLGENITKIEDTELQPALKAASTRGVDMRQPLAQLRQQALDDAQNEFKAQGNVSKVQAEINRTFDDYQKSYGDYVTLQDINDMKRGIRKSVNFNSAKLDSDVSYHLGQLFQKSIETGAEKLGLPDVAEINQRMAALIRAQKALEYINGKSIKTGTVGGLIKDAATAGGEVLGNSTGIPLAGAYIGREAGGYVGKKLTGLRTGLLNRTGKDAIRVTPKNAAKDISAGIFSSQAQKATKSR